VSNIPSYPKIYAIGHSAIPDLFLDEVLVEEKIDGSQISWTTVNGELKLKSKNCEIFLNNPEGMFKRAIEVLLSRKDKFKDGWIYRAEYLQKQKHNVLAYDRIPLDHLILFDINTGNEHYLSPEEKKVEAVDDREVRTIAK